MSELNDMQNISIESLNNILGSRAQFHATSVGSNRQYPLIHAFLINPLKLFLFNINY